MSQQPILVVLKSKLEVKVCLLKQEPDRRMYSCFYFKIWEKVKLQVLKTMLGKHYVQKLWR